MFKQEVFQSYPTILHSQQVIGYLPQDTKVTIGRWTFHHQFPTTLSTFFKPGFLAALLSGFLTLDNIE